MGSPAPSWQTRLVCQVRRTTPRYQDPTVATFMMITRFRLSISTPSKSSRIVQHFSRVPGNLGACSQAGIISDWGRGGSMGPVAKLMAVVETVITLLQGFSRQTTTPDMAPMIIATVPIMPFFMVGPSILAQPMAVNGQHPTPPIPLRILQRVILMEIRVVMGDTVPVIMDREGVLGTIRHTIIP
ncbi:uncharacterized protein EI90DRAFT_391003 [Cantharellus anzutake]|uniref:uncharacterized protein n=1 Tax=Cantharellus anzutake TaxID=1750568 RepID=UPI001908F132|nr:uncharacterized protein EI90DRAFT_391003 [Cantharellus anzutake]KAF8335024.1 hypothetical protein EI90DRAFT_391003 [Cantharellus anzutake]